MEGKGYHYLAIEISSQHKVLGQVEACDQQEARRRLVERELYPILVITSMNGWISRMLDRPVNKLHLSLFCRQLAALIRAGIPLTIGLEHCMALTRSSGFKKHLNQMIQQILSGSSLSESLRREGIFPPLLVGLVACGEASGRLDEVLEQSAIYYEKQIKWQQKIKKALTYPVIVSVLMIGMVSFLMATIIPSYISLLEETGATVPGPTQLLMTLSASSQGPYGIFLILGAGYGIRIGLKSRRGNAFILKLPGIGSLYQKQIIVNFSTTLSMLLESGISLLEALNLTKEIVSSPVAMKSIEQVMEATKEGRSLAKAMTDLALFPALFVHMVQVGEVSGTLTSQLRQMGQLYQEEVDLLLERISAMIEPCLLLVMAVVIGSMMAAVVLPTFSAATALLH